MDRIIGELQEFKRASGERFSSIEKKIDENRQRSDENHAKVLKAVEGLNKRYWRFDGGLATILVIISVLGVIIEALHLLKGA